LVLHDMLGLTVGKAPMFAKNFLERNCSVQEALMAYVNAVKAGEFPEKCHEILL